MREWRLIYSEPMEGAANMAADEAILRAVAAKKQPPTLRVYGWNPFSLSLGYGQRIRDADLDRIIDNGWTLVRRPTGGRAILHGDELTYSVTLPEDHPIAAGGIIETYLRLSNGLMLAMERMGLNVQADPDGDEETGKGPVCFEVPSKYEITVGGKKLIGSAQLRRGGGVLQHGTLPLYGDIARICDALAYASEDTREQAKAQVRERAATMADAGLTVTWDMAATALAIGMAQALDIELEDGDMSDEELKEAEKLYTGVYTTEAWNAKR
ncbi:MAG: biotin/lipoate A/B protein ligase family protein [Chloroflexota bacterium]